MSDLTCDHCGGIAFTSHVYHDEVYWFADGDGEKCASCGMPGFVSVDGDDPEEDAIVTWNDVQEAGVYCERIVCEECEEMRAEQHKSPAGAGHNNEGGK